MERRIKTILAGVFFIVASLAAAPCRAIWWGAKTDSVWVSTPVALDGNDKKWHPSDGDDDSGITYAFANDGKNLYLMLFPHTKSAKDQLAGTYIQDFTIWVDTKAGKARTIGLRIAAPASRYDRVPREVSVVGIDTASAVVSADSEAPDIKLGPVTEERGILEARIPLSLLGAALPEKITVGLETSAAKAEVPHSTKPAGARNEGGGAEGGPGIEPGFGGGGGRHGGGGGGGGGRRGVGGHKQAAQQEEDLTPLQVWIKVTMARPAKAAAK